MRKRFNGKQIVALALAVTMMVSEVGVVQATSATEQAVEVASEEVTEEPQVLEVTTDEVPAVGASTEVPATTVTELTKPGQVTNLRFDSEVDNGITSNSKLSWDAIQEADGYEIRIMDANGVEYRMNDEELSYLNTTDPFYDLTTYMVNYLVGYEKKDEQYVLKTDDKGNYYKLKSGETYKVSVRAYNKDKNGTLATVYGAWSADTSYTIPVTKKLETVTNIRIEERVDGSSLLCFTAGNNSFVEMEIIDANGKEYANLTYGYVDGKYQYIKQYMNAYNNMSLDSDWARQIDANNEFVEDAEGNYIYAFQPGVTYTIRLRGAIYGDDTSYKNCQFTEWSAPLTYTCVDTNAPEQPGQFKYDEDNNRVDWSTAKGADGYEVELKDANGNWFNDCKDNKLTNIFRDDIDYNYLSLINLKSNKLNADGTGTETVKDAEGKDIHPNVKGMSYTIRVRAYNSNRNGDKQYSDWSTPYTFTIPAEKKAAPINPTKVAGVIVEKDGNIKWAPEANAEAEAKEGRYTYYEIEVKDNAGREYYPNYDEVVVEDKTTYKFSCAITYGSSYNAKSKYLKTYTMIDGSPVAVCYPGTTEAMRAFAPGKTYTVRVRACRTVPGENGVDTTVSGDWSDSVSCEVPVSTTSTGVNAKPAQVTGLWIQTTDKADETLKVAPVMYWNDIENVDRYEIEVKDSKGNLYAYQPTKINGEYVTNYPSANYNEQYISGLLNMKSYSKVDGSAMTILKNADGTDAKTFQAGETYTIRVRAINRYEEYDVAKQSYKTAVEHQGDWSEPVTYTPDAKTASAVTGLYYVKSDDDYYYFTYKADKANSVLYYQIATDDKFNSASIVRDWVTTDYDDEDANKLVIAKNSSDLDPSTTYYVRVVNSIYDYPSTDLETTKYNEILSTAAVTSFTTEAKKVYQPKNITGLKVYSEDSDSYTLRFDAVFEKNDGNSYELQLSTTGAEGSWITIERDYDDDYDYDDEDYDYDDEDYDDYYGPVVYKSDLAAGTNYIRAIAYVMQEDENGKSKKVYGQPSNSVTLVSSDAMTAIGNIKLVESDDDAFRFSYAGNLRLDENIEVWYSDSKDFDTNNKVANTAINSEDANVDKKFSIDKSNLKPGKTYYVKARTINNNATSAADKYSAFSNVVKIKTTLPEIHVYDAVVTKNSIKLNMGTSYGSWGWITGYEIQKKSVKNKKTTWTTINRSSASVYTDKKLKSDTTYTYRVRPYYFDNETNATVDGTWTYYEAMTGWSGSLKLQAKAASKTSVKLSWTKISGAKGYEIYRRVANSVESEISGGEGNGYSKYKQIANVSSSKKSYTDKKLTSGMSYKYIVKAYKTVGGKKVYIQDSASASLDFELNEISQVQKSNGKVTVNWNPVYSAKGYLIEKYDYASGKWSKYKTIKKVKTSSYTFPATKDMENGDRYRIRAYKGTEYTYDIEVYVYPVLATPTKVKATATSNGIKVSWKAVSGADYYRVYRTTNAKSVYNKDTKSYDYDWSGQEVGRYVADDTKISGYRERDLEDMNVTSIVDQRIVYSENDYDVVVEEGPDTGVKYYYYVKAYKKKPQHEYVQDNDEASCYSSGASKAASATIKETKPAKTSISKATSKSKTVTLTFKASKNADGYEIARSTKKKKGYKVIGTVNDPTKLTYKDKYNKKTNKLKKGKKYYYKVRAFKYNNDGSKVYSSYSSVKKVKVK